MYTLYYSPGACSLATQVVLNELGQAVKIIDKNRVDNFSAINPAANVPVLLDGNKTLTEGAAILLHILDKHQSPMLPANGESRQKAIQDIMFANATVHPAYSKLFFLGRNITDENAKLTGFNAAAATINGLWAIVESELQSNPFLGGSSPSAADILLAVYSRWGTFFPVDITFGEKTTTMLNAVQAMPSFTKAVDAEAVASAN
ncbi:MAG: glutathione S-transferase family protein [Psychrosphaera sp.]|nr:glutathione S-transferase family protein [Psychrosphaera sp.]